MLGHPSRSSTTRTPNYQIWIAKRISDNLSTSAQIGGSMRAGASGR